MDEVRMVFACASRRAAVQSPRVPSAEVRVRQ